MTKTMATPNQAEHIALLQQLPAMLLPWYARHQRDLPWRKNQEPYRIWLSEIMLQQTRVEAVLAYYERFLATLPDIPALAACPEDKLLKLWQGLGYYSRARNLHKAAQEIMTRYDGHFPQTYAQIRALPGIGDYTAGAIASICFGLPEPAVDGNVLRFLSRFLADSSYVDSPACKQQRRAELQLVYPGPTQAGNFCQSLMELGATICLPRGWPRCQLCPVQALCLAHAQGKELEFPLRTPAKARRTEELTVLLLRVEDRLALRQRPDKGLLAGLWELPHWPGHLNAQEVREILDGLGVKPRTIKPVGKQQHVFTHITWHMLCYEARCQLASPEFIWANSSQLAHNFALPTAFNKLLP